MAVTRIKLNQIEEVLAKRLNRRVAQFEPGSPKLKSALFRIGFLIEAETKLNVRRQRLIDTGRLINSIRFTIKRKGSIHELTVGSFGVPYAAVHEFGFRGSVQIREHRRLQTMAFGRPMDPPSSVNVRSHSREVNIPKRPYLRPALTKTSGKVVDILRELFKSI